MAKVRGMMIETRRPLMLIDPNGMQINLGRAGYEDIPESPIPVTAYDGINIMPTPWGYRSAFAMAPNFDNVVQNDLLKNVLFQEVICYQTINGYNIQIGLAEGNMFLYDHSVASLGNPERLIDWTYVQSVDSSVGVTYLWTHAYLDNRLYIYHQGSEELFVVADLAITSEAVSKGARLIYESQFYQLGIYAAVPTFLNMEGQLGIFKANNRLGFWDTDNAIAWSSALDKFDFTPSATTFAGVTKFTSVKGNITLIKQHGEGFIVYSTGSIIHVVPTTSNERWSGQPIMSDTGVLFYNQVAVAQPDTVHYIWTAAGLQKITSGTIANFEPEFSKYLQRVTPLVALRYLGGKYLAVMQAEEGLVDSDASRVARLVYDGAGNPLILNPAQFDPNWDAVDYLFNEMIGGGLPHMPDWEPVEDPPVFPNPKEQEALLPCYTGWKFISPIDDIESLSWDTASEESVNVSSWPGLVGWKFESRAPRYYITEFKRLTALTENPEFFIYDTGPIVSPQGARFIDKAGEEFAEIIGESMQQVAQICGRFQGLLDARIGYGASLIAGGDTLGDTFWGLISAWDVTPWTDNWPYPLPVPETPEEFFWDTAPMTPVTIKNVMWDPQVVVEDDGCKIQIKVKVADFLVGADLEFAVTEENHETYPHDPAFYTPYEYDGPYVFKIGNRFQTKVAPGTEREVIVFQCETSGFGYFPKGGFSFRKTHSRSIFKPCEPANVNSFISNANTITDKVTNNQPPYTLDALLPGEYDFGDALSPVDPGVQPGTYTPSVPGFPPTSEQFANFGIGIISPYYPVFVKSYIYDLTQEKWGILNYPQTLLYSLLPANRTQEVSIANSDVDKPFDVINFGGVYAGNRHEYVASRPVLFMNYNSESAITYGRIGLARAGFSRVVGGSFALGRSDIKTLGTARVTVAATLDNGYMISTPTWEMYDNREADIPFVLEGRWYTVTIQGQFDINSISLYGKTSGRLRFPPPLPPV